MADLRITRGSRRNEVLVKDILADLLNPPSVALDHYDRGLVALRLFLMLNDEMFLQDARRALMMFLCAIDRWRSSTSGAKGYMCSKYT